MKIQRFTVGSISTNCYLVSCEDTLESVIIDSDYRELLELEAILHAVDREGLNVKYLVNTHGHSDHVGGNRLLMDATGARLLMHESCAELTTKPVSVVKELAASGVLGVCPICGGTKFNVDHSLDESEGVITCGKCNSPLLPFRASPPPDILLQDGDEITFGGVVLNVIHTPGHSPGGICLYSQRDGVLFSGDTIFKGSIGRTDLPRADHGDILRSVERLTAIPDDTRIYPGHGEATNMDDERAYLESMIHERE